MSVYQALKGVYDYNSTLIALPGTRETHGRLNRERIRALPRGVILVKVARQAI